MRSHEVIREAVDTVGVKMVAGHMRVSPSLVYKWCQESQDEPNVEASGAMNPLDRVVALWQCTRHRALVDWVCQQANGTYVPNPVCDADVDTAYVERTQELIQDFSRLLHSLAQSMADDSQVDAREADRIRRAWQELKQCGESFVVACEKGLFARRHKG